MEKEEKGETEKSLKEIDEKTGKKILYKICEMCNGTGHFPPYGKGICGFCNGTGWVDSGLRVDRDTDTVLFRRTTNGRVVPCR